MLRAVGECARVRTSAHEPRHALEPPSGIGKGRGRLELAAWCGEHEMAPCPVRGGLDLDRRVAGLHHEAMTAEQCGHGARRRTERFGDGNPSFHSLRDTLAVREPRWR